MQYCDLHVHSDHSDGTCTVPQLLEIAKAAGLRAIALTDHNTVSGLREILAAETEIEVIPGVTAALSGSAVLGAPLTHDFAVISLSDALTPWEKIEARLSHAAQ